jgi:hypothetical protein
MLSPSGSLVVVDAVRLSFVFGEAGLNVGGVVAGTRSHVTLLSVDVEAVFPFVAASWAEPAGIDTTTFPRVAMPPTATL